MSFNVKFKCTQELKPHEYISITGNDSALGSWNPSLAIKLKQINPTKWETENIIPILKNELEYKYIIKNDETPTILIWESFPQNRKIHLEENSLHIITDIYNIYEGNEISILPAFSPKKQIGTKRNSISTYSSSEIISNFIDEKTETQNKGIIMISFNLPLDISFDEQKDIKMNLGKKIFDPTLFKLGTSLENIQPVKWIGSLGNNKFTQEEKAKICLKLKIEECYPVFLDDADLKSFEIFNEQIIKPMFHGFFPIESLTQINNFQYLWDNYRKINEYFAEALNQMQTKNELILISGNQLLMLPQIIRTATSKNNSPLGFYFHTPFPSCEILRAVPYSKTIVESLLQSDMVGFQIFEYARNFKSSCSRLLGCTDKTYIGGTSCINYKNKEVLISIINAGIYEDYIIKDLQNPNFLEIQKQLKEKYRNKIVISSIDNFDVMSGIENKLIAFNLFLKANIGRELVNNIKFLQFCTPGAISEESIKIKEELILLASKMNEGRASPIIEIFFREVDTFERQAILSITNILFQTQLRDGFCILPFEYIIIQKFLSPNFDNPCISIVSEFSGIAHALAGLLKVNPYMILEENNDIRMPQPSVILDKALAIVLSKQPKEWSERIIKDYSYIIKFTAKSWLEFIFDKIRISAFNNSKKLNQQGKKSSFSPLNHLNSANILSDLGIQDNFSISKYKILILNIDSYLNPFKLNPKFLVNFDHCSIMKKLAILSQSSNVHLYIKTLLPFECVKGIFSSLPQIGLIYDFGTQIKFPSTLNNVTPFYSISSTLSKEIRKKFLELSEYFCTVTPGSFVIENQNSIIWSFAGSDKEFGIIQALSFTNYISNFKENYLIRLIKGEDYLAIIPNTSIKCLSEIAKNDFKLISSPSPYKIFFLFVGSDASDIDQYTELDEDREGLFKQYEYKLTLNITPSLNLPKVMKTVTIPTFIEDLLKEITE